MRNLLIVILLLCVIIAGALMINSIMAPPWSWFFSIIWAIVIGSWINNYLGDDDDET